MRKTGFILLLLLGCLCFTAGGADKYVRITVHSAELSVDRASAEQWHCERICNSDLGMPRLMRVVVPFRTAPASFQGRVLPADKFSLHAAADGGYATRTGTSVFHFVILSSGARAADYYVYRLRRLII